MLSLPWMAAASRNAGRSLRAPARAAALAVACAVAGAAIAASPGAAAAQRADYAKCKVDTTAEWYRSQKEFYSPASDTWTDDTLRAALLKGAGFDPKTAFVPELGYRLEAAVPGGKAEDTTALGLLRRMSQRRQWPSRATVGTAGMHAAWMIAQHDSSLAVGAMHRMMEAGPGESSPAEVAVLEDARRVQVGRGQIHGTQFRKLGGKAVLAGRLEDSTRVDMRRDGAWLPPLAVSACLATVAK